MHKDGDRTRLLSSSHVALNVLHRSECMHCSEGLRPVSETQKPLVTFEGPSWHM